MIGKLPFIEATGRSEIRGEFWLAEEPAQAIAIAKIIAIPLRRRSNVVWTRRSPHWCLHLYIRRRFRYQGSTAAQKVSLLRNYWEWPYSDARQHGWAIDRLFRRVKGAGPGNL